MSKQLGNETLVTTMTNDNCLMVEIDGAVRRMTLENFLTTINSDNQQLLQQVAWGIPLKQSSQSSTYYGVTGNTTAWEEYKRMCGRYLVTNEGKAAKLCDTNSAVFADGTTLDESKGHVMVIAPRLYYLVKQDATSGIYYLWLSTLPIGGHYIGSANGGKYNCIGAYKGAEVSGALVSRSGLSFAKSKTISAFWAEAQVNGANWGLTDYGHRQLMMMFGLSEYGDTNIQAKLGYGVCGSGSSTWDAGAQTLTTGATKSLGDDFGKVDITLDAGTNCSRVNLLGIEDPYGWVWEMIQGVYAGSSNNSDQTGTELFFYEGNRMPSDAELTTHPNGNYRQATRVTSSGYVQELILGEYFDIFPAKIGGGSSSYWADYSWANTTGQLVLWGGNASYGAYCGLACARSYNAWSSTHASLGSRLAYYGDLTFVNGADL